MIRKYISSILLTLLLMACSDQKLANSHEHEGVLTNHDQGSLEDKAQTIQSLKEDFIIVTSDYDFEKDYYGINLLECNLESGELKIEKQKIEFGSYKDILMSGMYNSSGAYYPVQFDMQKNKLFLSIYKADEMEGLFDYNKILEYDLQSNSLREVATFSDYISSWYYSKPNYKIYGFDNSIKSFVSINLVDLKVDTLFSHSTYLEDIEYYLKGNEYLEIIAFNKEAGTFKLTIDFKNNSISKTELYSVRNFSSYNNGRVVETFKDFGSNVEELRLYSDSKIKTIPFNFKNFNTYWINESEFVVMKDDVIQKMNTDLEVLDQFKMENIHVIDVLKNSLVISYGKGANEKLGIVGFDFEKFIEIREVKPNELVLIKNK